MIRTYIEWIYPGSFFYETITTEVPNRQAPAEIPTGAYGYRFFSRQVVELDGEALCGKNRDHSGWTYFGEELTADQVQAMDGERFRILRDNVRINGWKRLVRTSFGRFFDLRDNDRVEPPRDAKSGAKAGAERGEA